MNNSTTIIKHFLIIFFKNKMLFFILTMFSMLLIVTAIKIIQPVYLFQGSLIVKSKRIPASLEMSSQGTGILPPTQEDALLETRIITSPRFIDWTVKELRKEHFNFNISLLEKIMSSISTIINKILPSFDDPVIERDPASIKIQDNLTAELFPGSTIIDVSFTYPKIDSGLMIINRILDNYLKFRLQTFSDQFSAQFYEEQVERYKNSLQEIDSININTSSKYLIADAEKELESNLQIILELTQEQERILDDIREHEQTINYLINIDQQYSEFESGKQIKLLPPIPIIQDRESSLDKINLEIIELYNQLKKFTDSSQQRLKIVRQIKSEISGLIITEQEIKKGLLARLEIKSKRINQLKNNNLQLRKIIISNNQYSTDVDITRRKYEAFAQKRDEALLESSSILSQWANVQVLLQPISPSEPHFPKTRIVLPLGFIFSIFLALSIIIIKELMNRKFTTPNQIQEQLDLPVLFSISADK